MVFKFTIVSDEIDEFVRVIEIDSEATFLELNNAILESVKYDNREMTTFFTCSDDWEKEQEITLVEMESSSEYDNLVMEETKMPSEQATMNTNIENNQAPWQFSPSDRFKWKDEA